MSNRGGYDNDDFPLWRIVLPGTNKVYNADKAEWVELGSGFYYSIFTNRQKQGRFKNDKERNWESFGWPIPINYHEVTDAGQTTPSSVQGSDTDADRAGDPIDGDQAVQPREETVQCGGPDEPIPRAAAARPDANRVQRKPRRRT
jgi:hypothetical protein